MLTVTALARLLQLAHDLGAVVGLKLPFGLAPAAL